MVFKAAANLGDFVYDLTESGTHRGRKFAQTCGYFGARPGLPGGLCGQRRGPIAAELPAEHGGPPPRVCRHDPRRRHFQTSGTGHRLRQGIVLARSARQRQNEHCQRVTLAYGESIWIPRAISAWGEIIRVFDPSCHEELPGPKGHGFIDEEQIDHRWVRIRRPTIVVGGELLLDNLEITANPTTGIAESPLQLKSNCGTLVIDDFGRQQVAARGLVESLDRAAGKTLRFSQSYQRPKDPGAVRPVHRIFHES